MPKQSYQDLLYTVAKAEAKLEVFEQRLQDKEDEIKRLISQVETLQEALVAKESPDFYSDIKQQEYENSLTSEDKQKINQQKQHAGVVEKYIQGLEEPLFKDPTDLTDLFLSIQMSDTEPKSLHDNDES